MINFFAIVLIIFIGIILLVLKKRSFKKLINKSNLYSIELNKNNNFSPNKNSFLYNHEEKKYSVFYKNSQRNKMFSLFKGNTENKLKALKIAEELADKSTLPILRKGLKDISPEVVEISAFLIRKFK
ncbi:annexin [Prochlorococcus marinus XMU1414]|uniref:Annexin n=2 Tax=Prochlorococcus marinus TaxID=1219 RepID=A0A9D9G665_PROMR|nr:annexin [Prochlorococcus marinus]MBO8228965.1 annexin [Prochlorococcus marinus XMU1414]MBW3046423.1 annexin [Prochlorococcus marinus str. MU1414]MCR8531266.1 annexin [Prochlorococcus marinus XMU1420]MCR8534993.1 annexin [Prochlorococcus marinus XMU1424]